MGNRARLSGLNIVGMKRRGVLARARSMRCARAYRMLFAAEARLPSGSTRWRAVLREQPRVMEIVGFIRATPTARICQPRQKHRLSDAAQARHPRRRAGRLPAEVIGAARADGRDVFVLAFDGRDRPPAIVADVPHAGCRSAPSGAASSAARTRGAGERGAWPARCARPSLDPTSSPICAGLQLLRELGLRGPAATTRLFRAIIDELEREGFRVVGADDLVGGLLAPGGPSAAMRPRCAAGRTSRAASRSPRARRASTSARRWSCSRASCSASRRSRAPIALLARCAELRREGSGGVLVKLPKPGQERRVDLPTIGPRRSSARKGRRPARASRCDAGDCLIVDARPMVERGRPARAVRLRRARAPLTTCGGRCIFLRRRRAFRRRARRAR